MFYCKYNWDNMEIKSKNSQQKKNEQLTLNLTSEQTGNIVTVFFIFES